jgi:iron-sulfur cluster repair protein YtfE (RIC family)
MLNQIAPLTSLQPKSPEAAVDLLVGCHQRIRHFTGVAVKLAHAQGAAPEEIAQAAAGVHRYYSVSLPLHEADEDQTLQPRLRAVADEQVRHALLAMGDQHQAIDELIERLLPLLVLVTNNPDTLPEVGGEMCSITKALEEIFRAHLQMEEEIIFPAIRQALPESTRADILREMQERRKQGSGTRG